MIAGLSRRCRSTQRLFCLGIVTGLAAADDSCDVDTMSILGYARARTEFSDMDDAGRAPEEDVLYSPVPCGAAKGTRREQLKNYMPEKWVPKRKYTRRSNR